MSKDQKARLRRALEEFNRLPPQRQAALRKKAKKVGEERLLGLAGKDVKKLPQASRLDAQAPRGPAPDDRSRAARGPHRRREGLRPLARRPPLLRVREELDAQADGADRPRGVGRTSARPSAASAVAGRASTSSRRCSRSDPMKNGPRTRRPRARPAARCCASSWRPTTSASPWTSLPVFEKAHLDPFLASPPEERAKQVERFKQKRRWWEAWRMLNKELSTRVPPPPVPPASRPAQAGPRALAVRPGADRGRAPHERPDTDRQALRRVRRRRRRQALPRPLALGRRQPRARRRRQEAEATRTPRALTRAGRLAAAPEDHAGAGPRTRPPQRRGSVVCASRASRRGCCVVA